MVRKLRTTDRLLSARAERYNAAASSLRQVAHVENIQPRIKPVGSWAWRAPSPGFSPAQQRRLAEAYLVASLRSGRWLIPAFHYNIDKGGPTGEPHDDPQEFDLNAWAVHVQAVEDQMRETVGRAPP